VDFGAILTNFIPILTLVAWALAAYLVVLWAASVLWTYRDISSRSGEVLLQVLSVSLALFIPFAGVLLHAILRPRETQAERYERTLEEEYLRRDLEEKYVCPGCQRPTDPEFILCPHCHTALRRRCGGCDRAIDLTWVVCPYCGDDGSSPLIQSYVRRDTGQIEAYE
jgi:hypothetical protein